MTVNRKDPISGPESAPPPPSMGQNHGGAEEFYPRPTVLLVDEEPLIRWSLGEAIAEAGYVVRLAASGEEAEEALVALDGHPLIVLLDLRLPDVVDVALLKTVRTRRPDAPVFVLSALMTAEGMSAARQAGVTGFVRKPFDVSSVVSTVRAASAAPSPAYTR